jgi:hypothetical protein
VEGGDDALTASRGEKDECPDWHGKTPEKSSDGGKLSRSGRRGKSVARRRGEKTNYFTNEAGMCMKTNRKMTLLPRKKAKSIRN